MEGRGPYVGPKPFSEERRDVFFGRSDEVANLRALLRTERIVVLHSPSGAGKTSLIHAGLVPKLREDGLRVLPSIRVHTPLPASAPKRANRYAYSVLRSLEESSSSDALAGIDLSAYFEHRSELYEGDRPALLVFDQFEEIFNAAPHDHRGRVEFFTELAEVLRNKQVWALFAMREEYVAALDRYKRLVPAQLSARFHLDFLGTKAARDAIAEPARLEGIPYESDAIVDGLLRDLAGLEVDATSSELDAAVIDPLHLQLICSEIWHLRPEGATTIDQPAVDRVAQGLRGSAAAGAGLTPVGASLMRYYAATVFRAAQEPNVSGAGVSEGRLRTWIDDSLIEKGAYRRMSLAEDDGLREAAAFLDEHYVLRATIRVESTWYEIAHDRLVGPIRHDNDRWYAENFSPFEWNAWKWCASGHPEDFPVVRRLEWRRFERRQKRDPSALGDCQTRYLAHCRAAWRRKFEKVVYPLVAAAIALVVTSLVLLYSFRGVIENQLVQLGAAIERARLAANEADAEVAKRLKAETREFIGKVQGTAARHRWRLENHDLALLLGKLAVEENRRDGGAGLPAPALHGGLWSAVSASPFSQTVPPRILGEGAVRAFSRAPDGVLAFISREGEEWGAAVLGIGSAATLGSRALCDDTQAPSPDGSLLLRIEQDAVEVVRAESCASEGRAPIVGGVPDGRAWWHADSSRFAVLLVKPGKRPGQRRWQSVAVFAVETGGLDGIKRIERGAGDPLGIDSVALGPGLLALGDDRGRIKLWKLGTAAPAEIAPGLLQEWSHATRWLDRDDDALEEEDEKPGRVLAMSFFGGEGGVPRLAVVHQGAPRTRGGRVFVHDLSNPQRDFEVVADEESRIREAVLAERAGTPTTQRESFTAAHFAVGGPWLVTAGERGAVTRWRLADFEPVEEGGNASATGGEMPSADAASIPAMGASRRQLGGLRAAASVVFVTEDGSHVFAANDVAGIRSWDLRPREHYSVRQWTPQNRWLYALAFHGDGRSLIATHNGGVVEAWNVRRASEGEGNAIALTNLSQPGDETRGDPEEASDDTRPLASVVVETDRSIRSIDVQGSLAILGLGRRVKNGPGLAQIVDLRDGSTVDLGGTAADHPDGLWASAFRPSEGTEFEGRLDAVTGDYLGNLLFWDLERTNGSLEAQKAAALEIKGSITSIAFHPGGDWLAVSSKSRGDSGWTGRVDLVDMAGSTCSDPPCLRAGAFTSDRGTLMSVAFTDDRLVTAGARGVVHWWSFAPERGRDLREPDRSLEDGVPGSIVALALLPLDDHTVVSAGRSGVQVWSLTETHAPPERLPDDGGDWRSIAVNRSGTLIAAGDSTGRFAVWDLIGPEDICELVMRDITESEWKTLAGAEREAVDLCPGHPKGPLAYGDGLADRADSERNRRVAGL